MLGHINFDETVYELFLFFCLFLFLFVLVPSICGFVSFSYDFSVLLRQYFRFQFQMFDNLQTSFIQLWPADIAKYLFTEFIANQAVDDSEKMLRLFALKTIF